VNIFGVGLPEVAVIFVIAILIFGPKKLPELGRTIGKTLNSLQKASGEFQKEIDKAVNDTNDDENKGVKNITSTEDEIIYYDDDDDDDDD